MKSNLQTLIIGFLMLLLILSTVAVSFSQVIVKARIGIQVQSNGGTTRAKSRDEVKVGDGLRLYVIPDDRAFLYVLRTDKERVKVLNHNPYLVEPNTPVILPSQAEFYNIDGSSEHESFIVIYSPTPLKEVQDLIETPNLSHEQWASTEEALVEKSRIKLTEDVKKPIGIAGVMRSLKTNSDFLKNLPMSSGNTLVVKKYDFAVKK